MPETSSSNTFAEVPRHLAIIMDGNSRWARARGETTTAGHRAGVESVRGVLQLCMDNGIRVVTLFAFSSENWQRPGAEVKALMTLLVTYLKREIKRLHKDGVRVRFIGNRQRFSAGLLNLMTHAEQLTAANTLTTLIIAVDYGGQWDIAQAAQQLAAQVKAGELEPEQINENLLDQYISLADLPKPDLCIRTGGEHRISNFLLWQLAYAELFFTETLWPDFAEPDLAAALASYNQRVRRFGRRNEDDCEDEGFGRDGFDDADLGLDPSDFEMPGRLSDDA